MGPAHVEHPTRWPNILTCQASSYTSMNWGTHTVYQAYTINCSLLKNQFFYCAACPAPKPAI
ncbi:hypothetical protein EDC54_101246 [Samsonia erythrinae]|uniref:Uncharacterized protein n=1 Tax=Samsonia erythrinae TaxID=160434 RepID=A0A4R3VRV7_9GAMM|nr:hypothetical protein EDC54_101246 [Samsonia erythrinae]